MTIPAVADIQAQMDSASTTNVANIQRKAAVSASVDEFYVVGVTAPYAGKAGWIRTTSSDSAATQAAAILLALKTL
ncbi:MAG: hypothetical protein A3E01_00240 [Gammaproteobacteria bacterium RIFCSPHIGHO2_12_FULL_63_22]|nr:MAG: hypothetical protein A3E01_00240 [Gammaproteobacteria bacterium RIFCSPHIGHO2_12_FULL_63_22]